MTEIRKKVFVCLIAAVLASLLLTGAAYADDETDEVILKAQDIDTERELSLTVEFEIDGSTVSGAQISIYKAASVYTEGGAVFYTALAGDYSYEGITAGESNEIASELSQMFEEEEAYGSETTDSDGIAVFEGLEAGIYLVVLEEAAADPDGNEYIFEPYLACVPLAMEEDGEYVWTYEVVSTPKTAAISKAQIDEPETDEPGTDDTQTPSVGDESDLMLWAVLAAAACSAGTAAFSLRKKRKNV